MPRSSKNSEVVLLHHLAYQSSTVLTVCVTLIGFTSLFGVDAFLPLMPMLQATFSKAAVQAALSTYLIGLAFAQLLAGQLDDYYGERKVLTWGALLFMSGSIMFMLRQSLDGLLVARLFQGVGAGFALVVSRSFVGKALQDEKKAAQVVTISGAIIGCSPLLSPLLSHSVLAAWGLHAMFTVWAVYALVLLSLALLLLRVPPERDVLSIGCSVGFAPLVRHGNIRYVFATLTVYGIYSAYLAEIPFIIDREQVEFQLPYYAVLAIFFMLGNVACRVCLPRYSSSACYRFGLASAVCGGLGLGGTAVIGGSLPQFAVFIACVSFGNGFLLPITISKLITSPMREVRGRAVGYYGFLQFLIAASSSFALSGISTEASYPFGIYVLSLTIVTVFFFHILH